MNIHDCLHEYIHSQQDGTPDHWEIARENPKENRHKYEFYKHKEENCLPKKQKGGVYRMPNQILMYCRKQCNFEVGKHAFLKMKFFGFQYMSTVHEVLAHSW